MFQRLLTYSRINNGDYSHEKRGAHSLVLLKQHWMSRDYSWQRKQDVAFGLWQCKEGNFLQFLADLFSRRHSFPRILSHASLSSHSNTEILNRIPSQTTHCWQSEQPSFRCWCVMTYATHTHIQSQQKWTTSLSSQRPLSCKGLHISCCKCRLQSIATKSILSYGDDESNSSWSLSIDVHPELSMFTLNPNDSFADVVIIVMPVLSTVSDILCRKEPLPRTLFPHCYSHREGS